MRALVSVFFSLLFAAPAFGQTGNEWINYSQPYIKIPVGKDGLYRVTYQSLQTAGFPIASDPAHFQLFHRGTEVAIHVEGQHDGSFDPDDYVEFYGRRNDGTLDSSLYADPVFQPHRYYNLYNDTSAYFLTAGSTAGRRMPVYSAVPQGPPEIFHDAERLLIFDQNYSPGENYGNVLLSTFDKGEGWTGAQIIQGQQIVYTIDALSNTAPASGKPQLEILLTGRGPMAHDVEVLVGNRLWTRISFAGFDSYTHTGAIEWSDIDVSGTLAVAVRVTGSSGPDRVSAGYIRLVFPQQTTLSGVDERVFRIAAGEDAARLQISGATVSTRLIDITDPLSPVRITTELNGVLDAAIDRNNNLRKVLATSQVLTPHSLRKVSFRQIDPSSFNYVIITHSSLQRAALGYADPVAALAEYRSTAEGGGYQTAVMDIRDLYDQFNYGETSPRAIYQFLKYCAGVKLPDFMFLVGKGLDVNYAYWRYASSFTSHHDLVPTAGYPASDMLFSAGLGETEHTPAVATGRLTANSPAEVAVYVNKLKEREALPYTDLNRKRILHLSGGIEEHEPALFRQILQDYQTVAEDLYLGGRVQAIAKQSTNLKLINIADELNRGLGMITFFGHSAPNTTDFDIGMVSDPIMGYHNAGKYPFMLMNGCDAGSFFLNTAITGENWVLTPDKGAVGFIAHSAYGLLNYLQLYSATFYDVAFADSVFVAEGAGIVQQEVARRFLQRYGSAPPQLSQAQQMVLLGDPALRIFGAEKPDYAPVLENLMIRSFSDEPVTAFADSFRLEIPIRNYGIARSGNIRINVQREYHGTVVEYDTIIPAILYEQTIAMTLKNPDIDGHGMNLIKVHVDADDRIDELDEDNNTAAIEYFIPLNSTRNLFPHNHSIVSKRDVTLSFQFTDPSSGARNFILEVDTTKSFDSPFRKRYTLNAEVLARVPIVLAEKDSVAYFWRTMIANPLETESREWAVSSFSYIEGGPEGWAQLHFDQLTGNPTVGLVSDRELRRMEFEESVSDLAIKTFATSAGKPIDSVSLRINGAEFNLLYQGGACRTNTINLVAFDRRSTLPYAGIYFKWYELLYDYGGRRLLCGREPYVINSFTPEELVTGKNDDLIRYVDSIADGDTVMLFSMGNARYTQWPAAAKEKLLELGISVEQLNALQNGDAVVIFGSKGAPPGSAEVHQAVQGSVHVERTLSGRFTSGSLATGLIGPAQDWKRLIPRTREVEATDDFAIRVVGVKANGAEATLRTGVRIEEDLSDIDAGVYPYIRLLFDMEDDTNLTAVQLSKWFVLFEPFAEGMVYHRRAELQRTALEGETVFENFGFVNVSEKEFRDSVLVRVDVVNEHTGSLTSSFRIGAPPPGDTTRFTVPITTAGRGGANDLQFFVNPRILPEMTFDNNVVFLRDYLYVSMDRSNPVLEVTFDGRHLRDNDFVSPAPTIAIRLWDENRVVPKTDTLGVSIFLARPCEQENCDFEPIYFSRSDVQWYPASDNSTFTVAFKPQTLTDGTYRLRVNAQDGKGNAAGEGPYDIRFRVEGERLISHRGAYPNPFSGQAGIEVLITGDAAVSMSYALLVSTPEGKIVHTQTSSPGALHIGTNTIEWDGARDNGNSLPAGLYLYRLMVTVGSEQRTYVGKLVKM